MFKKNEHTKTRLSKNLKKNTRNTCSPESGCQNRLNFFGKNNRNLQFKSVGRSFSMDFFAKRSNNKSTGNNYKFIAVRHANVDEFFRPCKYTQYIVRNKKIYGDAIHVFSWTQTVLNYQDGSNLFLLSLK